MADQNAQESIDSPEEEQTKVADEVENLDRYSPQWFLDALTD